MSMFADNPDFFPTPRSVARRMLSLITNAEAKYFLEPSAGKGDIADAITNPYTFEEYKAEEGKDDESYNGYHWCSENRRVHVDVIENYPDLIQVLRGKEYDVVGYDWLTYEGVSYYDAILMNPPFSEGAKHLLKAWRFLHNGEIVCLLNEETIKNPYTDERRQLIKVIEEFGAVEYLGDCFSEAEHKTDVNVAMVYLKKTAQDDCNFVNGVCEQCGDPEIDELAEVECEMCRAIFEHTGVRHCPIHENVMSLPLAPEQADLALGVGPVIDFA